MESKPYYAVIFTSTRTDGDNGYAKMAHEMENLAKNQLGYMGIESAREQIGITISYWETLEAIAQWKGDSDHILAQKKGIKDWYSSYHVRICKVEREYIFTK